ncbi:CotO family spore coat protein [Lentibacillus sp. N15]|uniref:CotO family spore coat protein n=1 Tax=Lentibacillus songyuanensis TaxID=3136161 RepID=UPI0031BBAFEF
MVRKRYARDPLFYIQQPEMKKTEAPMQDNYTTPKRTKIVPQQQNETNVASVMPTRGNNFQQFQNPKPTEREQLEEAAANLLEDEDQKDTIEGLNEIENNNNGRPRFKDMTIEEKIDYFVSMPPHIPKLKCEIKTEERTYRGIVISQEEEEITLRTGRRNFTIPMNTITEIRMLGL